MSSIESVGFSGSFKKIESEKDFKPYNFSDKRAVVFDGAHFVKRISCGRSTIFWELNEKTLYIKLNVWIKKSAEIDIFSGGDKIYSKYYNSQNAGEIKLGMGNNYESKALQIYAKCDPGEDYALLTGIEMVVLPDINSKFQYDAILIVIVLIYMLMHFMKINRAFGSKSNTHNDPPDF